MFVKSLKSQFKDYGYVTLFGTVISLSIIADFYAGDLSYDKINSSRVSSILLALLFFCIVSFLLDLISSLFNLRKFHNSETGEINLKKLWVESYNNPLSGIMLALLMFIGVTNAQDLSEVYRNSASLWHDQDLWQLESSYIKAFTEFFYSNPIFWDGIYFSLWPYLIFIYAFLYKVKNTHYFSVLNISIVVSFFMTRFIAIKYPTTGPAFFKPDLFNISGTVSYDVQKALVSYMKGEIVQNGFIPGTMGMPSLHVGLIFITVCLLARHSKHTLWLTFPWLCLVWLSTIMLGWHYIVDGLGGIIVASVSISFAQGLLKATKNSESKAFKLGAKAPAKDFS